MATRHVPPVDNLDSLKAQVQSIPAEDEKRAFHTVLKQLEAVLQTIENKDKLDSGEKVATQDVGHLKGLIKDIAKNEGVETTFNHSNEKDQQLEGNYHTLTRLIEEGLELNPNSKMEEAYQYAKGLLAECGNDLRNGNISIEDDLINNAEFIEFLKALNSGNSVAEMSSSKEETQNDRHLYALMSLSQSLVNILSEKAKSAIAVGNMQKNMSDVSGKMHEKTLEDHMQKLTEIAKQRAADAEASKPKWWHKLLTAATIIISVAIGAATGGLAGFAMMAVISTVQMLWGEDIKNAIAESIGEPHGEIFAIGVMVAIELALTAGVGAVGAAGKGAAAAGKGAVAVGKGAATAATAASKAALREGFKKAVKAIAIALAYSTGSFFTQGGLEAILNAIPEEKRRAFEDNQGLFISTMVIVTALSIALQMGATHKILGGGTIKFPKGSKLANLLDKLKKVTSKITDINKLMKVSMFVGLADGLTKGIRATKSATIKLELSKLLEEVANLMYRLEFTNYNETKLGGISENLNKETNESIQDTYELVNQINKIISSHGEKSVEAFQK